MKAVKILLSIGMVFMMAGQAKCQSKKSNNENNKNLISVFPQKMKHIGSVSKRYLSYNVEMVSVVGGNFWKPYKMMKSLPSAEKAANYDVSQKDTAMYRKLPPINLKDKRLLNLAKGLAPAYVRVSGTWANGIYFQDNDKPEIKKAPDGFVNVLTRKQWKGVLDFIKATNSKLVTSFAVSNGVRNSDGVWMPEEAQKIVDFTRKQGGSIAAAELFNEPNMPTAGGDIDSNYDANDYAKDIAAFNKWAEKEDPNMLIVGPGTIGDGIPGFSIKDFGIPYISTKSMLNAKPKPRFDVFSYHY
jgi:hypothetical protein